MSEATGAAPTSSHANSSTWTSFLKSVANFNGDLSSLTAPPFILSPVSLSEYPQYWAEHPDLLLKTGISNYNGQFEPAFEKSDVDYSDNDLIRMLHVVRWFISTLKSQYCSRSDSMGTEKKPLNPFLGELFVGKWEHESDVSMGSTACLSEQVSHHPPVTAYSIFNEKNNVSLEGYYQIKSSFSGASLCVKQYGHTILSVGEDTSSSSSFLLTLPSLHLEGMLLAAPFVELENKSYIQSSKNYYAVFEYSGRGYFSGKKNTFKCKVYKSYENFKNEKEGSKKTVTEMDKPLCIISGQWSGISNIYTNSSDEKKKKNGQVFYDASRVPAEQLKVKPIEEQNPLETRRAWEKVATAIKEGNYNGIHAEKTKLEDAQRILRQQEEEENREWENRWFKSSKLDDSSNDTFIKLAKMCNLSTHNVPSGTRVGDKYDLAAVANESNAESNSGEESNIDEKAKDENNKHGAAHWRFVKSKWDSETEVKL